MVDDDVTARVMELEIRLAYQDQRLQALDDFVGVLSKQIAVLQAEIARLREASTPTSTDPN
jgi:uncharacterized coiled-coil protein SlyX